MATLSALRLDLQTRFQDKNGGFLSTVPANLYLNMGMEDFQADVQPVSREYGYYPTAKQFRYDLPADYIHSRAMVWYQNGLGSPVEFLSPQEFKQAGYLWKKAPGIPEKYTIIDEDLYLGPAPVSSSNTSTLNGAIVSTSATSLTVTTGTQFYENAGIILVDSEQIAYQAIDTTTGGMTLCLRGQGGTTAATHLTLATVYRCDLVMTYAYGHTYLTSDSQSPAYQSRFHRIPVNFALAMALKQSGDDSGEAEKVMALYEAQKIKAKREIRRQVRDVRNRKVSTPYS